PISRDQHEGTRKRHLLCRGEPRGNGRGFYVHRRKPDMRSKREHACRGRRPGREDPLCRDRSRKGAAQTYRARPGQTRDSSIRRPPARDVRRPDAGTQHQESSFELTNGLTRLPDRVDVSQGGYSENPRSSASIGGFKQLRLFDFSFINHASRTKFDQFVNWRPPSRSNRSGRFRSRRRSSKSGSMLLYPLMRRALLLVTIGAAILGAAEKKTYTYKTVGDLVIQADVYRPDADVVRPAIFWIHGGALIMVQRRNLRA